MRPHANLDMRLFMSLRAIHKDCRHLAEGDGHVPNPAAWYGNVEAGTVTAGGMHMAAGVRRLRAMGAGAAAAGAGAEAEGAGAEGAGAMAGFGAGAEARAEAEAGVGAGAGQRRRASDGGGRVGGGGGTASNLRRTHRTRSLRGLDTLDASQDSVALGGSPAAAKCRVRWNTVGRCSLTLSNPSWSRPEVSA